MFLPLVSTYTVKMMLAISSFTRFLLSLMALNSVLCDQVPGLELEEKIHQLEIAVQRAGCQRYLSRGYHYGQQMHLVDSLAYDNVEVEMENGNLTYFKMHLAIKGAKDGIILLSPIANPGKDDLVYEIVVGIDFGVITVLRTKKEGYINRDEVVRVHTSQIISTRQYTQFYIILNNDVLTFGKEGDSPLFIYSDVRLRQIKYFDMTAYGNYEVKFLYDCPAPVHLYT